MNNSDINRQIERIRIQLYLKHVNNPDSKEAIIAECPITSVTQKQMEPGQSIPDAIIIDANGKNWLEETSFSRSKCMHKDIGKARHNQHQANHDQKIIYISTRLMFENFHDTILKKIGNTELNKKPKSYGKFAEISTLPEKGILLVTFEDESPFFDYREYSVFLNFAQKNADLFASLESKEHYFYTVIFGGYVVGIGWKFAKIWSL
jgi:hypothetical protein